MTERSEDPTQEGKGPLQHLCLASKLKQENTDQVKRAVHVKDVMKYCTF